MQLALGPGYLPAVLSCLPAVLAGLVLVHGIARPVAPRGEERRFVRTRARTRGSRTLRLMQQSSATDARRSRALVTGAASGIGRQVAIDLHRQGWRLELIDRDEAGLRRLLAGLDAAGDRVVAHVVDVAVAAEVEQLEARLASGPLDLLVNSAGVLHLGPFERMPPAELERVLGVNLIGAALVTRALLPRLLEGTRPCVVQVGSAAGLVGAPGMAAYSASKFGLLGLAEALRGELRGRVHVCTVCPTFVRTNIVASASVAGAPERGEAERALAQLGASPGKVARAILEGARRRRRLVLVNPGAHALHLLHRLSPALTEVVVARGYRWLQRRGVLAR